MKRLIRLLFFSTALSAMENQEIILFVEEPVRTPSPQAYEIDQYAMRRWVLKEINVRDNMFAEAVRSLKYRIDEIEDKSPTINSRTKIALIATAITSFTGFATALITFFTAKYGNGSN